MIVVGPPGEDGRLRVVRMVPSMCTVCVSALLSIGVSVSISISISIRISFVLCVNTIVC